MVKNKEGEVSIDFIGKANGRGAYICPDIECLKKAHKRDALSRALQTKIDETIYDKLEKEFEENE